MSLINKSPASTFKDVLQVNNSNNGISTTLKQVKSGSDDGSSLYISKNNVKVQPETDSTNCVAYYDEDGNALFTIDSVNDLIKAGVYQNSINTQYIHFGIDSKNSFAYGTDHTAVPVNSGQVQNHITMGTGTDPATSLTISTEGGDLSSSIWYVPDNISIDSVSMFIGSDTATGDTTRFHLMSFDIDISNTSTSGDLSNGVVLADGSDIVNSGYEQTYFQSMTIQNSDVSSGKVVMFFFKSDSVNSDYSINTTIKYHLT